MNYELYKQLAWETGEDLEIIESYGFELYTPCKKEQKRERRLRHWREQKRDRRLEKIAGQQFQTNTF